MDFTLCLEVQRGTRKGGWNRFYCLRSEVKTNTRFFTVSCTGVVPHAAHNQQSPMALLNTQPSGQCSKWLTAGVHLFALPTWCCFKFWEAVKYFSKGSSTTTELQKCMSSRVMTVVNEVWSARPGQGLRKVFVFLL